MTRLIRQLLPFASLLLIFILLTALRPHTFFTAGNMIFLAAMFVLAVVLGSVLTDLLNWMSTEIATLNPVATGPLGPK